jgi:RNA polymerase sigma-70 factor (ECF subfamily)
MEAKDRQFIANYNKYKDKIYTYFWYRVNFNKDLAEDLTAEVFLKAFKNIEDFDQSRSFQAWIYRIAHNHLINYYRTANREVDIEKAYGLSVDESRSMDTKFEVERIMSVIKCLDPYCREVLELRFIDQLSNSEIAELLDKDEGAVRTQISRAIQTLKSKLSVDNIN